MNGPAGDFDYERHGAGYAAQRRTDPLIASYVHAGLGSARSVLNVGAGTGSYEPHDRRAVAVEPSAAMRAQRAVHLAPVVAARAEQLPFADDTFDAAMATITVHQWPDPAAGLREMRRVARGPVVILTFDGAAMSDFWLAEYAPEFIAAESPRYPTLDALAAALGGRAETAAVPVPLDCTDGFVEAFYGRPEALLDPVVRSAQSAWRFVDPAVEARAIERLGADLASGAWDDRHGRFRTQPQYVGSLRLVVAIP